MKYIVNDTYSELEIEADSPKEAAEQFVEGGDWGERNTTIWVSVLVREENEDEEDAESHMVTLEPEEPECVDDEHDWQRPLNLVGGCRENPGVFGHGGGVIIHEVCVRCGCGKTTDTWAQNPETGEQGLCSVQYEEKKYEMVPFDWDEHVDNQTPQEFADEYEDLEEAVAKYCSDWRHGEFGDTVLLDEDAEEDMLDYIQEKIAEQL